MELFAITFKVTEYWHECEDAESRVRKHNNILGYFTNTKDAIDYLMKYYLGDPTQGDKQVEVIDEYMQTTIRKQGNCYGKVQKKFKNNAPEITYTEEMEIKKITQLNADSNPEDAIISTYCG